jgi:hypothetical protein
LPFNRWFLVGLIAGVSLLGAQTVLSHAQPAGQNEDWARLGPQGPGAVTSIAIAPGWPNERLILGVREDGLIRTRDGALTWERVPAPATVREGHVHFLGLLPTAQGTPAAYLLVQDPSGQSTNPWRLLRSTDAGTSWTVALSGPRVSKPPRVVFSPAYARDGVGFVVAGGELWRTRNAGVTWQQLNPRTGQRVQTVALSPEYATDQTVFLAATVQDPPTGSTLAADRASDHVDSAGVLVSTNGGETWTALVNGLRLDEDPFRNVYDVTVSPTYRQDGTLFAYAAGPVLGLDPQVALQRSVWNGRLFRSTDRGQSWEVLPALVPSQNHSQVTLFLSPNFAQDGLAFAAVDNAGPTPASSGCTVLATSNRGVDWTVAIPAVSYYGCEQTRAVGAGADFSLMVRRGGQWRATPGIGERLLERLREGPAIASPVPYPVSVVVSPPDFPRDRTVFVGGWGGGIWSYGTEARRTDGRLPCPTEVGATFRQIWDAEAWVHGWLGCASSAERRVRIRETEYPPSRILDVAVEFPAEGVEPVVWDLRAYWTEDEEPGWYRISQGNWTAHRKGDLPWPEGPIAMVEGTIQRFEGGTMMHLTRGGSPGATLVLVGRDGRGSWRELLDGAAAPAPTPLPVIPSPPPTLIPL